jgi:hypothetical protein
MKSEPEVPECTWITHQLMKGNLKIQIWGNFLAFAGIFKWEKQNLNFFLVDLELI